MLDPQFMADISKASLAFAPMTGQNIASFVNEVYETPLSVAQSAAQMLGRTR
jgi:hypothetical protein